MKTADANKNWADAQRALRTAARKLEAAVTAVIEYPSADKIARVLELAGAMRVPGAVLLEAVARANEVMDAFWTENEKLIGR